MEGILSNVLKSTLIALSIIGVVFHLLVLKRPDTGKKVQEKLGAELGARRRFVPWLEKNRMQLDERLIRSKAYNIFAVIFLIILLILLSQP